MQTQIYTLYKQRYKNKHKICRQRKHFFAAPELITPLWVLLHPFKYSISFAVKVTDGLLTHLSPLAAIWNASTISRVIWSLCFLMRSHLSRRGPQFLQDAQWMARLLPVRFLTVFACSLNRSFTHLPVCPMYERPQESGMSYTTAVSHSR